MLFNKRGKKNELQLLAANAVPEGSFDESNTLHSEFRELRRFSSYVYPLEGEFPSTPVAIDNVLKHLSFQNGYRPTETCLHGEVIFDPQNVSEILRSIPKEYLTDFVNLRDNYGDSALHKAVKLGDAGAIRILLAEIPEGQRRVLTSQKNRDNDTPLQIATYQRSLEAVIELFQEGEISRKERGRVARIAANENNLEIVHELLQSDTISKEDRGQSVNNAALNGSLIIIRELLRNGEISKKHREKALMTAIYIADGGTRFLEIVHELLQSGPISEESRGEAALRAIKEGHIEIVQELLKSGKISDEDRGEVLWNAVMFGYTEIVQTILASGEVSEKDCGRALRQVISDIDLSSDSCSDIVHELLQNGRISDEDRGWVIIDAIKTDQIEITHELLQSGPISDEDRGEALINAVTKGYNELSQQLLQSR